MNLVPSHAISFTGVYDHLKIKLKINKETR